MLEVIDKGACRHAHPTPLLFVHGAWHAAWCWDAHFLDFFADNGYRALAVSLRGHGQSRTPKRFHFSSVADYVDDVASVAESLAARPVVIGHSMGGAIVQKYLESHHAPAGVLLASIPPRGIGAATMRYVKKHPWIALKSSLTGNTMATLDTPRSAREHMFSARTPESLVVDSVARFQPESRRTIYLDLIFRNLPRPQDVAAPMLVLGAGADGSILVEEVHATARAYRTVAELFPGMGHDMMLEPEWRNVADRIDTWLTGQGL